MGTRSSRRRKARSRRRRRLLGILLGLALLAGGVSYLASGGRFARYMDAAAGMTGARTTRTAAVLQTVTPCQPPAARPPATGPALPGCPQPAGPLSLAPPSPDAGAGQPGPPASPAPPAATAAGAGGPGASAAVQQVLSLINQARRRAQLPPYTISRALARSALAHDDRMAAGCGLSHQCPGEPPLGARESAAGEHWRTAGENIGEGGPEPATASAITRLALTLTRDMLNERPPGDGHRRNLLSPSFRHIGIAIVRDRAGTVWLTQDFSG
jgi:uncharacterized protein YkwD